MQFPVTIRNGIPAVSGDFLAVSRYFPTVFCFAIGTPIGNQSVSKRERNPSEEHAERARVSWRVSRVGAEAEARPVGVGLWLDGDKRTPTRGGQVAGAVHAWHGRSGP